LETKTAVLGAYIPNDNLIGIGLSLDNIQSKNPINWTGQNLLGKALMDIREKFRADMVLATTGNATISDATISDATRSGATTSEAEPVKRVIRRRRPVVKQVPLVPTDAVSAPVIAPVTAPVAATVAAPVPDPTVTTPSLI